MPKSYDHPAADFSIVAIGMYVVRVSDKTTWLFLDVEFSDGIAGLGEASCFGEEAAVVSDATRLSDIVKKEKPLPFASLLAKFRTTRLSRSMASVLSALEQAYLVGLAQRAELPLNVLLGSNQQFSLPAYANINRGVTVRSPEGFCEAAQAALALGYRAVKLAPFDGLRWNETTFEDQESLLEAGVARVAAVRNAIGADFRLMVDCHWRLDMKLATRAVAMLSEFEPYWLEDLVDSDKADRNDLRHLRDLANRKNILVAGGENVWTMKDALALLNKDGLDVMLPDLRQTGIFQGRSILDVAAALGVKTSLHNPVGPVLDAISVQVAATLPNFLILERQVNESLIYDALIETPIGLHEGNLDVPSSAGLGVTISRTGLDTHSLPLCADIKIPVSRGGGPDT